MDGILDEIRMERESQNAKWGKQDHLNEHWLAILTEEVGEVAQCVCKAEIPPVYNDRFARLAQMRAELIQVAAVAVAWVEAYDRANP